MATRYEVVEVSKIVGSLGQPDDWLHGMELNPNMSEQAKSYHKKKMDNIRNCWNNITYPECKEHLQITSIPTSFFKALPIVLIKRNGQYYVGSDGNHRVRFAKDMGMTHIIAEVSDD